MALNWSFVVEGVGEDEHPIQKPGKPIAELGREAVVPILKDLFKLELVRQNGYIFADIPSMIRLVDEGVNLATELERLNGGVYPYHPYPEIEEAVVQLSMPVETQDFDDPRYRLYVGIGSVGRRLPAWAAHIVSASFASGLIARTVVETLRSAEAADRNKLDFPYECNLMGIQPSDLYPRPLKRDRDGRPREQQPQYKAYFETTFLSGLAQKYQLQAAGLFKGWELAGEIVRLPGSDKKFRDALWALIAARCSWSDLGELTSYAFMYRIGFLRARAFVEQRHNSKKPPTSSALDAMKTDDQIKLIERAVSGFFDAILQTVYGPKDKLLPEDKGQRSNAVEFLNGYHRGTLRGAADVFGIALNVGYGVGYKDGYDAGYARGYADGIKDGRASGLPTLEELIAFVQNVADIVKDVKTILEIAEFFAMFALVAKKKAKHKKQHK